MSRGRAIVTRHDVDGLRVIEAPEHAPITARLLGMIDAGMLPGCSVEGSVLTIAASNGTWRYKLGAKVDGVTHADLIEAV